VIKPPKLINMKKLLILLMVPGFFVAACNNNKTVKNKNSSSQEKDDYGKTDSRDNADENKTTENSGNSSWTETDRNKLLRECVESFDASQGDIANKICPCMLGKLEKEFTSYKEAETKGGEAASNRIALQCKEEVVGNTDNTNNTVASNWPQSEKDSFISNCVTNAMAKGRSRPASQNYCECMLNKMETLFPDINDAAKLTDEDIKSPEMKKLIDDCSREN
jgi:hypothetical protein